MVKKQILDFSTVVTIMLVLISLMGHKWSTERQPETEAQNLISTTIDETQRLFSMPLN